MHDHCNAGVTHTKTNGDLTVYSNHVWYNPKGIANILSLGMVQKNQPVTYNSQDGNEFAIHIPQQPTFNRKNNSQISEMLPMDNICMTIVTQE